MKRSIVIGSFIGLTLFTALVVWYGIAEIADTLLVMGWGILAVSLFRLALLTFDMLSWRALLEPGKHRRFTWLFWIRWVADSVNTLLPVARIGGEVLRARMLYRRGVDGSVAGASVMVDVTAGIFTQLLFSIVDVITFIFVVGATEGTNLNLSIGLVLFGLGVTGFYLVQHSGFFSALARVVGRTIDGTA